MLPTSSKRGARSTSLKALRKSNCNEASVGFWAKIALGAMNYCFCTTLYPYCKGCSSSEACSLQWRQQSFDTRRRVTSPAATGLIELSFFFNANKFAPANHPEISAGALPSISAFTTRVVDPSALSAEADEGP